MKDLMVTSSSEFTLIEDATGIPAAEQTVLTIEGYASVNRSGSGSKNVDRDGEVYDIPSLNIENYQKNGPILFTHDWHKVMGKALEVKKTFEGLYIKAEVHKVPGFESVFYGVQNKLITAFSISAIPKNYDYLEEENQKSKIGKNLKS